ncbi:hypothetical protein ACLK2E_03295 [Escherichia coli]
MPILTPMKQQITLGDVADIKVVSGPTMLKTGKCPSSQLDLH